MIFLFLIFADAFICMPTILGFKQSNYTVAFYMAFVTVL